MISKETEAKFDEIEKNNCRCGCGWTDRQLVDPNCQAHDLSDEYKAFISKNFIDKEVVEEKFDSTLEILNESDSNFAINEGVKFTKKTINFLKQSLLKDK